MTTANPRNALLYAPRRWREDGIGVVICDDCLNNHPELNEVYCICPDCERCYRTTSAWARLAITDAGRRRLLLIPCPECSLTAAEPRARCSIPRCTNDVAVNGYYSNRRYDFESHIFCLDHWNGSRLCDRCGKARVHADLPGAVVLGATRIYCERCAHVTNVRPTERPLPEWWPYETLDEWEAHDDCACKACVAVLNQDLGQMPPPGEEERCEECNRFVNAAYGEDTEDGFLCHYCAHPRARLCPTCNTPAPTPRIFGHCRPCAEAAGYWQCNVGCRGRWYPPNSTRCTCGGVYPYNYTPTLFNYLQSTNQRMGKRTPYLGFELEIEAMHPPSSRQSGARWLTSNIPWAYPVHDGTLRDRGQSGFEIVSHPFTFEWYRENLSSIHAMLTHFSDSGFRAWETKRCGMHIHISRQPMTEAHQMKFIRFIYGSTNLALSVGQRDYRDQYLARYAPFHGEDRSKLMHKIRLRRNPGVDSHYTAISTNKPHTLECRWFRGTLNPTSFSKNIEFVHSMYDFTRLFGMVSSNEMNYITWLREQPQASIYPNLLHHLEHNYITRR